MAVLYPVGEGSEGGGGDAETAGGQGEALQPPAGPPAPRLLPLPHLPAGTTRHLPPGDAATLLLISPPPWLSLY